MLYTLAKITFLFRCDPSRKMEKNNIGFTMIWLVTSKNTQFKKNILSLWQLPPSQDRGSCHKTLRIGRKIINPLTNPLKNITLFFVDNLSILNLNHVELKHCRIRYIILFHMGLYLDTYKMRNHELLPIDACRHFGLPARSISVLQGLVPFNFFAMINFKKSVFSISFV